MRIREVMAYSAHNCTWVSVTAIDIGRPEDSCVATESHPATIDDQARIDRLATAPQAWRWGETTKQLEAYLHDCGPSTVRNMAQVTGRSIASVQNAMIGNDTVFTIVDYTYTGAKRQRTAVWGLK